MTNTVLFLDEASGHSGNVERDRAEQTAKGLISTLRRLYRINRQFALNAALPLARCRISENYTMQSILGGVSFKEEWDFIRSLNDRTPFDAGFEQSMAEQIAGMELRTVPGQVPSAALAWALLLDSATVSFDAHDDWSRAWVDATSHELADDGNIVETPSRVRNASQSAHLDEHADWLRLLGVSEGIAFAQVWSERAQRFQGLRFLPRVENDLKTLSCSGAPYSQAIEALKSLTSDVSRWVPADPWPSFSTYTTPEHGHRREFCWVRDDLTGAKELFDWHVRFTGSFAGRVHFRVDVASRTFVIAYVGFKLTGPIA